MSSIEDTFDRDSKLWQVYSVLKDQQWHCRECEYQHVKTTQIAGGSGIQGLQRGTKSRDGMEIKSGNHFCRQCGRTTRHDRWTGSWIKPIPAPSMPEAFASRAVNVLGSRDIVENTKRSPNQLTVDHKLPMLRWSPSMSGVQSNYAGMTDEDIRKRFQLLKASNGSVSHNLLKSRSCERCFKTGKRGTPFGINFFYIGGPRWSGKTPTDANGCVGCGWFDFDEWRAALNKRLAKK